MYIIVQSLEVPNDVDAQSVDDLAALLSVKPDVDDFTLYVLDSRLINCVKDLITLYREESVLRLDVTLVVSNKEYRDSMFREFDNTISLYDFMRARKDHVSKKALIAEGGLETQEPVSTESEYTYQVEEEDYE